MNILDVYPLDSCYNRNIISLDLSFNLIITGSLKQITEEPDAQLLICAGSEDVNDQTNQVDVDDRNKVNVNDPVTNLFYVRDTTEMNLIGVCDRADNNSPNSVNGNGNQVNSKYYLK